MRKPLQEFIVGNTYRVLPVEELRKLVGVHFRNDKGIEDLESPTVIDMPDSGWLYFIKDMQCVCGYEFIAYSAQKYGFKVLEDCTDSSEIHTVKDMLHSEEDSTRGYSCYCIAPWMCQEVVV